MMWVRVRCRACQTAHDRNPDDLRRDPDTVEQDRSVGFLSCPACGGRALHDLDQRGVGA